MGDGADGCEHRTPAKSAEIVRNRSIMLATFTGPCIIQERGSGRKATRDTAALASVRVELSGHVLGSCQDANSVNDPNRIPCHFFSQPQHHS